METSMSRPSRKVTVIAILWAFLFAGNLWAGTTYYVDFVGGADTNTGTLEGTAWQHAPGDPNATGKPASVVLNAGDKVLFKGGVAYRGSITIRAKGTESNPVSYIGNEWGTGRAILDGSNAWSPTWTHCTSAEEAQGNAKWANMWWAPAPAGFDLFTPLYEDGKFLWFSEDPNLTSPIFYDRFQDFREVPRGSSERVITKTTIKDNGYFTQTNAAYWNNAYALIWQQPDTVTPQPVTSFDPATHTITFDSIPGDLYPDRSSYFAMVGPAGLVDIPGEFGLYDGKIFIWPHNSDSPANHTYSISSCKRGFYLNGCSYVTVKGFEIRGQHGLIKEYNEGVGIYARYASFIKILDNEIHSIRSLEKKGAIYLEATTGNTDYYVDGNHIYDCQKNQGILLYHTPRTFITNNTIEYVGYHGMMCLGITDTQISGNVIRNLRGTHAVGISVYMKSNNVLLANNRLLVGASNPPFCTNETSNLYVIGNVMDGFEESSVYDDDGYMTGTNYVLNNTLVRAASNAGLDFSQGSETIHFMNNIIDGGAAVNRSNNLYTGLIWNQTAADGWYAGPGEVVNTNVDSIFMDHANGNFHLKPNSPAAGAGKDVSAYYPTSLFPNFDFSKDIEGKPRTANWHMGAYAPAAVSDIVSPAAPTGLSGKIAQ